jgi:hypothetical protein
MSNHVNKVAWPGVSRGGGDLDGDTQNKLRKLLNEFGSVLEREATNAGLSIFVFPMFREFNLVAGITANDVIFVISPSVGEFLVTFGVIGENSLQA